jgi:hypothetical protein
MASTRSAVRRYLSGSVPYCIALFMEAAVFHRHVLFYRGFLFPWDFRGVHLPLAAFVADSFRRGELPLWDPYTYCGYPIFANIQAALFYLPALAAALGSLLLGASSLPRLLAAAAVLQISFAGCCTFAILRRIGAGRPAAWIAGTTYELGCFFASQAQHMGAVHGASWLPLAWLCVIELRASLRWGWLATLAGALAMSVFAGLPQVAVVVFGSTLGLGFLLAVLRLAQPALAAYVLLGWAWALLLAAAQIVPTIQLTLQSVAKYRYEWLRSGGGIKPGALWSLALPNHWNVFDLSKFSGPSDPTFLYLYSGLLSLALAVAAACWKPDRWARALAWLAASAAVWMLGDSTPIGRAIFLALPVNVRIGIHPEFTLCAFALALSLLAGCGANRFLGDTRVSVIAGVVIACDLILVSSGRPMNTASLAAEPGIMRDSADGSRELIARLRALTGRSMPPSRFDTTPSVSFLWSTAAPMLGIPTANGCDPLAPERMIQVRLSFSPGARWGTCYQVVNASSPVVGLCNVRYLLSRAPLPDRGLELAAEIAAYKIYQNKEALPRFFLVNRVTRVDRLSQAAALLHAPGFDPAQTAIVEAPDGFEPLPAAPAHGEIEVISYRSTSAVLATHADAPSFLVAAEAYYPGWEAAIDGERVPLYAADVAFRGIRVPAGDHRVEMRFVPRILYRSVVISMTALTTVLIVLLLSAWRRSKKSS